MKRTWNPLICMAAMALLVGACGPAGSGPDRTSDPAGPVASAPSLATEPVNPSTASPLSTDTPDTYDPVEIVDAGIGFEVPGNWQQEGKEWIWSPDGPAGPRVGLNWIDLQGPGEPEAALLPRPSQILGSQPIELPWASGRSFTVSVYGPAPEGGDAQAPIQSVETHVLVVVIGHGTRRAYDFYAAGSTAKELDTVQPVLDEILTSAAPLDGLSGRDAAPSQ